jgi:flavodoxin
VNTLVIYFSKFGHTQRVAESIASVIKSMGPIRVLNSDELKPSDMDGIDLVVMGSPTHKMNLPVAVRPIFERLPKRILRDKSFAVFDTSYKMSPFLAKFTAAKRLDKKLRKLGGKRVVRPETFHVMEREGPLFEGEIERAGVWANSILARLACQGA